MTAAAAGTNPARYSNGVLGLIRAALVDQAVPEGSLVLDPYGGEGLIDRLRPQFETVAVELEPEWAARSPHAIVGNALALPFADATFVAVATSCTYGNRMADHHDAQERCSRCRGEGLRMVSDGDYEGAGVHEEPCDKCDGSGRRDHHRNTYRHRLGRPLHADNAGQLQWGEPYRDHHRRSWAEAVRVLKLGGVFVLNVKDHVRGGDRQPVTQWHVATLNGLGLWLVRHRELSTAGLADGANREVRVPYESVLTFRRMP